MLGSLFLKKIEYGHSPTYIGKQTDIHKETQTQRERVREREWKEGMRLNSQLNVWLIIYFYYFLKN